jgi:hypothetical protein
MSASLVEYENHWQLPLSHTTVGRLNIDMAFHMEVCDETGHYLYRITIESPFRFQYDRHTLLIDPEFKLAFTPLLSLVFSRIIEGKAYKNGDLEITFEETRKIFVPFDANFEAWQINGVGGLMMVANAGGILSVWKSG